MDLESIPERGSGEALSQQRENPGRTSDFDDPRSPFDADLDKLLYSEALRRLEFVTQVVPAGRSHEFHSRAVHTHKVAQVARAIANRLLWMASEHGGADVKSAAALRQQVERFGGLDPTVAAAGALLHDLGHPPFGHAGEATINRIAASVCGVPTKDQDALSFEGNAQSMRIIHCLEYHKVGATGIQLVDATVNAAVKYPWSYEPGRTKYSAYETERQQLHSARRYVNETLGSRRTLEAEIVDIADDISYAVHDVEDFFRAGLVPLHRFRNPESAESALLCHGVRSAWLAQFLQLMTLAEGPHIAQTYTSDELYNLDPAEDTELESWSSVRSLMGDVPHDEEIKRCLHSHVFPALPLNEFDGDSHRIAEIREFSSQMIGSLLSEVEHCPIFGARLRRQGRIVVLALKWLVAEFVFRHSQLIEIQEQETARLQIVAHQFASILGLHLRGPHEAASESRRLLIAKEAERLTSLPPRSDGAQFDYVRWADAQPTWPDRFKERLAATMEDFLLVAVGNSTGTADIDESMIDSDASVTNRRDRGRLLLDALASMTEREVDVLASSINTMIPRRAPMRL